MKATDGKASDRVRAMSGTKWSFFRAGGVDQVILKSGADLEALPTLDKKLWVALACPTMGTEIDEKTLELIDTDKDHRIRPPEILAAIDWASHAFKDLDIMFEKGADLPLSALDPEDEEGKAVIVSAKRILKDQNKKEAKSISLDDVLAMHEVFAQTRFNGDGIVPADSTDDEGLKKVLDDVMLAAGAVSDRSGKLGVDKTIVEAFFKEANELVAWDDESKAAGILAFEAKTAAAAAALVDVEAKIDDYFTRCRIAAFDGRGTVLLGASEADLESLANKIISKEEGDVVRLPIAKIDTAALLPLEGGVNPAWAGKLATFREATVKVVLGDKRTLNETDFADIKARLAPYRAWLAKKPLVNADKLGLVRIRELVVSDVRAQIESLIAQDAALGSDYAKITLVEKAVRLRRDLVLVLRNFVNFADFYSRRKGSFQAGTLFLDARSCDLCIRVHDSGKHAALAGLAKAYLAYCECARVTKEGVHEKMTIVAAFTAGDTDNLMVGRNGVFYDRKGNDWDATIASIVENPISVRQAFWSPYKKLLRMIEEQVAKRAADKEKASHGHLDSAALAAGNADQTVAVVETPPPAAAPTPEAKKGIDIGTVAALGVAVAGISSFLGLIFGKFVDLGVWMPIGIVALLLAISGPSMLIAWLKLRQRNLGPILDASGWAVNARCKINVPFGASLTQVRELPEGAERTAVDPYAETKPPWLLYLFLVIVVALGITWALGKLDGYLPTKAQAATVLHKAKPAGSVAPAASASPAPK
ncbi:hypothetical protein BH09MYX1_BH09MYX1_64600 [soil metagenome]